MLAAVFLMGCGVLGNLRAGDDGVAIAMDRTLPGRKGELTCEIFGRELYARLVQAGGEAHYIVYNWKSMRDGWFCHAIVVFRNARG